jgi:ABC-type Fe3+/spermidine/putrescine transport system ATPase subunit
MFKAEAAIQMHGPGDGEDLQDSELEILAVSRSFGSVRAVDSCSVSIARGEIVALLGPSGCGKSTLLNMIAGFETPDAGEIRLRGRVLNDVPPNRRNIAMVFQHYALFPHMTAARNISYGLEARRADAATIRDRVSEMMALLKLEGLGDRYPAQMSGGQCQRVAIARALAVQPDVLLLDESFNALDRNLREEMQLELSILLRRLNLTTILVTHDQREAFSLANRIAVMRGGHIAQIGTPREMYRTPNDSYVLRFLGSTNSLHVNLVSSGSGSTTVQIGPGLEFQLPQRPAGLNGDGRAILHLRTEDVAVDTNPTAVHTANPATVALSTFLGAHERIVADFAGQQVVIDRPAILSRKELASGARLFLNFDPERCRFGPAG